MHVFSAHFLVRMMSYVLGKKNFQEHVKHYLGIYEFRIATFDKFWAFFPLEEENNKSLQSNITLKDIMESWILKKGYAHIKMTRDRKTSFVTVQQVSYCRNYSRR